MKWFLKKFLEIYFEDKDFRNLNKIVKEYKGEECIGNIKAIGYYNGEVEFIDFMLNCGITSYNVSGYKILLSNLGFVFKNFIKILKHKAFHGNDYYIMQTKDFMIHIRGFKL